MFIINSPSKAKLNKKDYSLYSHTHTKKERNSLLSSHFWISIPIWLYLFSVLVFSALTLQLLSNIHQVDNFLLLETYISEMSLLPNSFAFPLTSLAIPFSSSYLIFHYLMSRCWNSPGLDSVFYSLFLLTQSLWVISSTPRTITVIYMDNSLYGFTSESPLSSRPVSLIDCSEYVAVD